MDNEEKFSEDMDEHYRIENEILRIKLKAQYGENFQSFGGGGEIPPEIENQFLKNMIAFEDAHENAEYTTVYKKIGSPEFKNLKDIKSGSLNIELERLNKLMEDNGVALNICDGPYADAEIYRFITEELFLQEIEKENVFGGTWNFIYEEFYPNNAREITERTKDFLKNWFERSFGEYNSELSSEVTDSNGKVFTREELQTKLNLFFNAFKDFKNYNYNIEFTQFDEQKDGSFMGFSEGVLKYDAEIDNGEIINYEGPFKLYMQRVDKWWCIFHFVVPGFIW